MQERFSALKCPECTGALHNLHSYSLHCLDCGATPLVTYAPDLKEAQDLFDAAQGCIDHEKIDEALDKLKQCLCIRRNVLYKHHEDIAVTLDLIGKVYAIMGQFFLKAFLPVQLYVKELKNFIYLIQKSCQRLYIMRPRFYKSSKISFTSISFAPISFIPISLT